VKAWVVTLPGLAGGPTRVAGHGHCEEASATASSIRFNLEFEIEIEIEIGFEIELI
jgi:hypothetical protein